jgi:hypothetical protein
MAFLACGNVEMTVFFRWVGDFAANPTEINSAAAGKSGLFRLLYAASPHNQTN